ncbi:MAG: sulfatase-like hydrolase/transferase [Planctomycetota bacterium]
MSHRRSHIIIFNPDQWRGDVMGHMGNPAARTPNLDRLVATDAVAFRHAFCQNPVCTPSRCSFMTGWYPHVRGHRTMHHMLHHAHGEPNLLRILRDNGYFVWWGGKNDLVPGQDGFDDVCDVKFRPTDDDRARWGRTRGVNLHGVNDWRGDAGADNWYSFYAGRLEGDGERAYGDGDWANVLGAIDFLRDYDGDKPLCLFLPLQYPHPPYAVEEPFFSAIDRAALPERIGASADMAGKPSLLKGIRDRQKLHGWTEDRWDELRATYYGMCMRLDHQFGLLVDALKDAAMYDDAAIFLFSDHGDFTGDYGLVEKTQNTFEDCLSRVPFIIKPPADAAVQPRVSEAIVELVDFSETVYALTGVDPDYTRFGRSLLDVIAGRTDEHRDAAFCEGGRLRGETEASERESTSSLNPDGLYWPRVGLQQLEDPLHHTKAAMCRTKTHKYVRRHYESDELYDLAADPGETQNLIDDPAYAPVLAELKERMLRWYMATCDVVPHQTDKR